jgi:hypothetical protein
MKRIITIVAFIAILSGATSFVAQAKDGSPVVNVLEKYEDRPGVESFSLGKFLIGIARSASDSEGRELLRYLDRIFIFDGEDASSDVKGMLLKDLTAALDRYERMMEFRDEEDSFVVYCRMNGEDIIKEMVMVAEKDMAVILFGGDIPLSKMQKLVEEAAEK